MKLYILNKEYERIALVDEADSILWNKKFNDAGECEIYVPCERDILEVLQVGNYVYRYDDDMFCQILSFEIETDVENGDYIIATAPDISTVLLSGRFIRWNFEYSGKVVDFIEKILIDNLISPQQEQRRLSNFEIDKSNFETIPDTIKYTTKNEDIFELIKTTCKAYNLGFRVSFDINAKKFIFRLYKSENKATMLNNNYVEFSPAFANMLSTNYSVDNSNFKNVVYVSYKTTNEQVLLYSKYRGQDLGIEEPFGEARKEIFVDGTGTSRDTTLEELQFIYGAGNVKRSPETGGTTGYYYVLVNNEEKKIATFELKTNDGVSEEKLIVTDDTYMLVIQSLANNILSEHIKTQEFSGIVDTIDTYEYKKDYDLGDVVNVINEYGISANAQITEVMESEDNDKGYIVEPKFQF